MENLQRLYTHTESDLNCNPIIYSCSDTRDGVLKCSGVGPCENANLLNICSGSLLRNLSTQPPGKLETTYKSVSRSQSICSHCGHEHVCMLVSVCPFY